MTNKKFSQCLEVTDKANIGRGLISPFEFLQDTSFNYQYVDLETLTPPFDKGLDEVQLFVHDHISVMFRSNFREDYEKLISDYSDVDTPTVEQLVQSRKKDPMSIDGLEDYSFQLEHRHINHPQFPVLDEILMRSERASLFYLQKTSQEFGVYRFKGKIDPGRGEETKRLLEWCRKNDISIPEKDTPEYQTFETGLSKKVYEIIGWEWASKGTKHEAAGRLAILSNAPYLVIDILSRTGVYSRIHVPQNKQIKVSHVTIQPADKFDALPPEKYIFDDHLLHAVCYKRNQNYSPKSCWLDYDGEFFINPRDTQDRVETEHIQLP